MNRNQLSRAARSLGRIFCIVTAPVVMTGCEPSWAANDVRNLTDESIVVWKVINSDRWGPYAMDPGIMNGGPGWPCFDFARFDITIEVDALDGSPSLRHSYVQRCGEFIDWVVKKDDLGEFYLEMVEPE